MTSLWIFTPIPFLYSFLRPNNKGLKSYSAFDCTSLLHFPPPTEMIHAQGKALRSEMYFAEIGWLKSWERPCFSYITGPAYLITITEYLATSKLLFIRNNHSCIFLLHLHTTFNFSIFLLKFGSQNRYTSNLSIWSNFWKETILIAIVPIHLVRILIRISIMTCIKTHILNIGYSKLRFFLHVCQA